MRMILALRRYWLSKGATADMRRACFYGARAVDRLNASCDLNPEITFTASGIPAVASYRVRSVRP